MRSIAAIVLIVAILLAPLSHAGRAVAGASVRSAADVQGSGEAHLLFVGDVMVGRYVGTAMRSYGYDAPFAGVKSLVQSADIAIGNLEGPVAPRGSRSIPLPSPNELNLTGDTASIPAIQRAGFDLMSVANNHSLDIGVSGLRATAATLTSSGITVLGTVDGSGNQSPAIRSVRGLRIAFLAYTAIRPNRASNRDVQNRAPLGVSYVDPSNQADKARFSREIAGAKSKADVVIVFMHWGTEYSSQADAGQKVLSQVAAVAGADLVVGAHPHVAQGMDVAAQPGGGRPTVIAYSLGNGLFDQIANVNTRQGLALDCRIDRNGVVSARFVPLEIRVTKGSFTMNVANGQAGQPTLQRASLGTPAALQWQSLWDATQPRPGLGIGYVRDGFLGDRQSDEELGLGVPTRVVLQGGSLSVLALRSGTWQTVWASDEGWQVTGYTVGDANADGQPDLVYSLWKKQLTAERPPEGGLRVDMQGGNYLPHIYINSWRDGEMRPLWHGSPRPAPSLSLAVAPIGNGGKPLLAVLESSSPQKEQVPGTLRIWEWTGRFGYELVQAVPGAYSQMWSDGRVLMFR